MLINKQLEIVFDLLTTILKEGSFIKDRVKPDQIHDQVIET